MVKIAQTPANGRNTLPEVRFENPRLAQLGIELMTLTELRHKATAPRLNQPERVDFFMLLLVVAGTGVHTVDFVDWPLTAGQMLFVRPGQVQQWHTTGDFEAHLILIDPSALPPHPFPLDEWKTCPKGLFLQGEQRDMMQRSVEQLRHDFDQFSGDPLDILLLRYQLMVLLTRFARLQQRPPDAPPPTSSHHTHRLFVQMLETRFTQERSLRYYAQRLGYSESTISRACIATEGRPAKEVIARRVVLEAKRRLAHSSASVAEIAHQLGFSEATNFVKFFRRYAHTTPLDFRQQITPPSRPPLRYDREENGYRG